MNLTFSSRLASLLKVEDCRHCFVMLSFSFQVWRYSPTFAMSLVSTPSTACQSPSACNDCQVVSICILSGDGGWQVRDVGVEEKGCQDRSLWDAVLEAS